MILTSNYKNDPMQEMFIFETTQQLQLLEQSIIKSEIAGCYFDDIIDEIFRIMHTIKSSSAMMLYNNISAVAHSIEDLLYFIREDKPKNLDISVLCDLVLEGIDFIKIELEKIKKGEETDGNIDLLTIKIHLLLEEVKDKCNSKNSIVQIKDNTNKKYYVSSNKSAKNLTGIYKAVINFQEDCRMENIRAFSIVHSIMDITDKFRHYPEDILENNESSEIIKREGFIIYFKSDKSYDYIRNHIMQFSFIESMDLNIIDDNEESFLFCNDSVEKDSEIAPKINDNSCDKEIHPLKGNQSIINVNVQKLDKLMDLVGEMVIAEAMVTQNSDLRGLKLDNFEKAARQLRKVAGELQDTVMSIRMVPLGPTLFKMNRIVRDMCKKLNKEIHLDIIGEDTEVDKNIIEHIGDPIMHIVRNAADHGVEDSNERLIKGKAKAGTITIEAKNVGSDVIISIKDDGRGLNKNRILQKAIANGLIPKASDNMTDEEVFNLIFLPGFSTKEAVSEFSGRGVGMDVVNKNIETLGGSILVDSKEENYTSIMLKIPLTLAIIDGINIQVGKTLFTIPTSSIKESFKPKIDEVFTDPDGNEMIIIRGICCPILRLHKFYKIETCTTIIHEGIMIMLEHEKKTICIFADRLIGGQQVVVKPLPGYIRGMKKNSGIIGCTLLGDGSISLILDANEIINNIK